jgi:hypothetical protein
MKNSKLDKFSHFAIPSQRLKDIKGGGKYCNIYRSCLNNSLYVFQTQSKEQGPERAAQLSLNLDAACYDKFGAQCLAEIMMD